MNTLNVVESVFFAALERDTPEARAAFLDEACAGDPNLRHCVERLLNAHPRAGDFLQAPAPGLPATVAAVPLAEKPGSVIGPYKLLQELGEGGFGVVFMAEQTEPVRRKVALKVIKPGMDSKQVVARFEQERQALALMDHPNIARVFDGGTTESGRPYFVMELVKGVPITTFCDENRLTPRERLGLFVSVCEAIQHAHQKGVIHRDIKPSNVLVALSDGKPIAKVIDFGIAKAVSEPLTDKTLFTRHGQVIGTLEYMSPEQATLDQRDIDTRSDVYALGVLLYELLTGSTPIDKEKLRAAGFAEMLRLIREEEVPRPSVRLSGSGHGLPLLAAYRKTESQKLPGLVRGELDWIALRALEKDRSRRYQSAAGLAEDVGRYLRDEQVLACPPSLLYRAGKFARKHKAGFTLAVTAATLLLLGATLSGWQAVRAMRAERDAIAERDDAEKAHQAAAEQRAVAVKRGEQVRRERYRMAMSLVQAAWAGDNFRRVSELLEQQRPGEGEEELRHFEWHYWDRQLHQYRRSVELADGVNEPVLSGDGTRVAYTRPDGKGEGSLLEVVETATERVLFSRVVEKGDSFRTMLLLSRDGRRVAFAEPAEPDKLTLSVWDVDAGKELFRSRKFNNPCLFDLDSAGTRLATFEDSEPLVRGRSGGRRRPHILEVWDLAAPNSDPIFRDKVEAQQFPALPVFSPDGSRLAAVSRDSPLEPLVQVWDTRGKRVSQGKVSAVVSQVTFSPDAKRLIAVGRSTNSGSRFGNTGWSALLWDCTGDEIKEIEAKPVPMNADTPLPYPNLDTPRNGRLVCSPDGRRRAVWSPQLGVVRLLDAANSERQAIKLLVTPLEVAFSKDGSRLLILGDRSTVRGKPLTANVQLVWQEWDMKPDEPAVPASPRQEVVWSQDGQRQAVFTRVRFGDKAAAPATISIRNRAGKEIHLFRSHVGKHRINHVQFSTDGQLVHSHAAPTEFRIWEPDTGTEVWSYSGSTLATDRTPFGSTAVFSPDGRLMILPGAEGATVVRFEPGLPKLFDVGGLIDAKFSPDSRRLVTMHVGPRERKVTLPFARIIRKLWDVESGRMLAELPLLPFSYTVPFSPDSRLFYTVEDTPIGPAPEPFEDKQPFQQVAGSNPKLTVWDSEAGQKRITIEGPPGGFGAAVFNRDGTRLVGGGSRAPFVVSEPAVWDVRTGKEVCRLEGMVERGELAFAFSPDGKRVATASLPGFGQSRRGTEVRLWDAGTGRELLRVEVSLGADELAFSDDGHRLTLRSKLGRGEVVIDATPRPEAKQD